MEMTKKPYLQMPVPDGITIMWETTAESTSEVEVYSSCRRHEDCIPGKLAGKYCGNDGQIHRVKIRGLEAGADYHYRVRSVSGDETLESDFRQFRTQGDPAVPFSYCVTAETGGYGGFNEKNYNIESFQAIREQRPDFAIFAGDMAADGRDWESWRKYMFTPGEVLLGDTPFYMCQGNHEENTTFLSQLFDFPAPGNYYGFDYGNAHFTVLDSTTLFQYKELDDGTYDAFETPEFADDSPQMRFLKEEMNRTTAKWRFVIFHYPPYASAFYEVPGLRKLSSLFEANHVDIVFNSHTIIYERSHPILGNGVDCKNGVTYVVVGGAGAMPGWFLHKKQWHTAKSAARPHFVQVSIAGGRLEFEAIDLNGCVFDKFTIEK